MKIEFNGNGYNASMNSNDSKTYSVSLEKEKRILRENGRLITAIFSFIIAISNLSFGPSMNFSTEILSKITERGLEHWIFLLFIVTAIAVLLSVLCGIFSIVLFVTSDKSTSHCVGLAISIVSFVLCALCLGLNIAGIVTW